MRLLSSLARTLKQEPSFELFADVGFTHTVHPKLHKDPFRYIIVDNFLPEAKNAELKEHFEHVRALGLGDGNARNKFRHRDMYDVDLYWPIPTLNAIYSPFFATSYFAMLSTLFGIPLSNDTILTYHHHGKSIADDYIHNDFSEGHFIDDPLPNGINPWYFQCTHSSTPPESEGSHRMARAMAGIYYLNDGWKEGDGGETAFFTSNDPTSLKRKVEPRNNRLMVFETTPISWHSYLKNSAPSRDSVAQWFFIHPDGMAQRFPNKPLWKGFVGY